MKLKRSSCAAAPWVCLVLQGVGLAQSTTLNGTITDPDGGAVKDALVQLKDSASSAVVRGNSSAKGEYSIQLAPGTYDLSVPMPCCQWGSYSQSNIVVRAGESRRLDIRLPWGANLGTLG